MLSVLVIDESSTRAADICAGLALAGCQVAAILSDAQDLAAQVRALQPDLVLIDSNSPSRETLARLAQLNADMARPVLMFTQDDGSSMMRKAFKAGVSAYVVDGMDPKRIKPLIEVARARFEEHQALHQEVASSQRKLSERKLVERAKGILMKARNLDEDAAYHALRKLAMERNRTIADVSRDVLDMAHLFS